MAGFSSCVDDYSLAHVLANLRGFDQIAAAGVCRQWRQVIAARARGLLIPNLAQVKRRGLAQNGEYFALILLGEMETPVARHKVYARHGSVKSGINRNMFLLPSFRNYCTRADDLRYIIRAGAAANLRMNYLLGKHGDISFVTDYDLGRVASCATVMIRGAVCADDQQFLFDFIEFFADTIDKSSMYNCAYFHALNKKRHFVAARIIALGGFDKIIRVFNSETYLSETEFAALVRKKFARRDEEWFADFHRRAIRPQKDGKYFIEQEMFNRHASLPKIITPQSWMFVPGLYIASSIFLSLPRAFPPKYYSCLLADYDANLIDNVTWNLLRNYSPESYLVIRRLLKWGFDYHHIVRAFIGIISSEYDEQGTEKNIISQFVPLLRILPLGAFHALRSIIMHNEIINREAAFCENRTNPEFVAQLGDELFE